MTLNRVATLPENLKKHRKTWNLTLKEKKKPGKNWNLRNFEKKPGG